MNSFPGGEYATLEIKTKLAKDFFKEEIQEEIKENFFEILHPRIMMETFIYLWENNKLEKDLCAFWFYVMYYRVSTELPYMCHPAEAEPYWDMLYNTERSVRIYLFSNAATGIKILTAAIEYVKVYLVPFYNVKDNPNIQEELKEDFAEFPEITVNEMKKILQSCKSFINPKIQYEETQAQQEESAEQKAARLNLCHTVRSGDIKNLANMLEQGADINTRDNFDRSLLIIAAENKNNALIKLLIEKRADLNLKGPMGNTALICSAETGNLEAVKMLINAKAALNIKNNLRLDALLTAIKEGYTQIAQELISAGADINQKDTFGMTPLMKCIDISKHDIKHGKAEKKAEIAEMLINFGADVLAKNLSGDTALSLAVKTQNQKLALMLVKAEEEQTKR